MQNGAQSVEQFLHGLGIASGEELMQRLTGMQTQIDTQQQNFTQQMTQALNQMTALSAQLNEELTKTSQAEIERRQVLALAAAAQTGTNADPLGGLVDSKGIGQPWKYGNKKEQYFQEWTAKFVLFISAKYGPEMKKVLDWSKKQRKEIVGQAFNAQQVGCER